MHGGSDSDGEGYARKESTRLSHQRRNEALLVARRHGQVESSRRSADNNAKVL